MEQSFLETRQIVKEYRSRRVVDQVSLQVMSSSVVGLLGPNGAGKTTTFYSIVGFIRPTSGAIFLDEEDITALPIHKRATRGITYLAQEPSVFKKLTVEENIRIVLEPLGLPRNEINNRIHDLLAELKIEHLAGNKLDLPRQQVALLGLLLLRGPQTAGELATRSERMAKFADAEDLRHQLGRLIQRGLAVQLPRAAGQREDRYMHLLGGPVDVDALAAQFRAPAGAAADNGALEDRVAQLEATVAALQEQLAQLQSRLDD